MSPLLSEAGGARRTSWVLASIALLFALSDLGGRSLHDMDTPRWGMLAREMVRTGEWLVPTRYGEIYANKPPLYLWCVAGPAVVLGEVTPFLVRLPAALGFVLLVLSTATWARIRTGSESIARLAGLLALSTFSTAWLAREGRLDMMGAGLATAAAVALDRAASGKGTPRTPWVAGLWLGAALLTKGPPLLLVPAAVLFAPVQGQQLGARLRAARLPLVFGLAIAIALVWFIPAVLYRGWDAYGRLLLVDQAADRIAGQANHLNPIWQYLVEIPTWMLPWGPLFLGALIGVLIPRVRRSLGPVAPLMAATLCVFIVFSLIPTKHVRYLAPLVPLFAMAVAWWGERLLRRSPGTQPSPALAMVATVSLVAVAGGAVSGIWNVHDGLLAALAIPLLGMLAIGVHGFRGAHPDPTAQRRQVLGSTVLLAACLILLTCSLRYRFRLRNKVRFNRAVAERVADAPVHVLRPMRPEDVFEGAPQALSARDVAALPAREGDFVVLREAELPALAAAVPVLDVAVPAVARHRFVLVRIGR